MIFNDSIRYIDNTLYCDAVSMPEIVAQTGTPVYIYSLRRTIQNFRRIQSAFAGLNAHVRYSAKANANLAILGALVNAGAGIDAVSAGEIHRALLAGAPPDDIVFAGVGKSPDEIRYALEKGVGWFNVENILECQHINTIAESLGRTGVRVALRFNPDVVAMTHPNIATGHGGAKFGLPAEMIGELLSQQRSYPNLNFAGIHLHIGSQLHDTQATQQAVRAALNLIAPYPNMRVVNIGGGLPVAYRPDEVLPSFEDFAATLTPLLQGYEVLLEPGRSIIADAGLLVTSVLYEKRQGKLTFVIVDGSMTELMRPALYNAHHEIVAVSRRSDTMREVTVVGPVCETTDVLGRDVPMPYIDSGDLLALLTTGAYGMAMSNNYNQRPRPPEVVVEEDGQTWRIARRRETWDDMVQAETNL
ncbi:MAG: diaminopimelate decarboxylase [Burkholderiales bacterium]|nr:diaminopimelate decarboxylase [Anaerolineae bacterium]